MSQPAEQELANTSGEQDNDDAVMAALLAKEAPEGEEARPEEEESEEDAESEEQEQAEEVEDDDPEIDLGDVKLKKSELRNGYMKDADYRQKTAELANQRRAVEQHAQAIATERQTAVAQLDVFLGALQRELIGTQPDAGLIESDPQEYMRQQALHNQRAQAFQTALQQRQAVQGRIDADTQRQQAEWRQQEGGKLLERLPAWNDTKVRDKESGEIAEYLNTCGYTADELNELVDHRALLVARDAAKYRQLQAAKAKQAKPEPGKAIKPGAAKENSSSKQTAYQDALAKARRTGKSEDIERALMLKGT